ncbi:MAG TPA: GNAT family N-acetyltransferase [Acidimicrobiales bacterium]|nr:GNAT family N-acetyltransferase [Acidimicrobiales bacterium]
MIVIVVETTMATSQYEPTYGPLCADDLPRIAELFEAHTGRPADLDVFGSWIERYPSAAARDGGVLVGFLVGCRFAPDVLELTNAQVAPSHRGRGIARALFCEVEESARRAGFAALIVAPSVLNATRSQRVDAPKFYERIGFRTVHTTASTQIVVRSLEAG